MTLIACGEHGDAGAGAVVIKSVVFPKKYMEAMECIEGTATGQDVRPRFAVVNQDVGFDPALHRKGAFFTLYRAGGFYVKPDDAIRYIGKAKKNLIFQLSEAPQAPERIMTSGNGW